jgi:limonene-1,2-epoxide hydrolase
MQSEVGRFLERFEAFGDAPCVERYRALFHPDATLFDAGMERPITVPEIPEHLEAILKLVPDFRMVPERHRERDGTVFVEARNEATLGPGPLRWRSIYCVDLEGDRVIRGRRYYDRRPLYATLDPSLPGLPGMEPAAGADPGAGEPCDDPEALVRGFGAAFAAVDGGAFARRFREDGSFVGPDLARPVARDRLPAYHAALHALLADLRMELVTWAGDDALAFAEWELHARLADGPLRLRVADRFDHAGGQIVAGRAYFDTLELATRLAGIAPSRAAAGATS